MQMVYNSDNYVVLQFDGGTPVVLPPGAVASPGAPEPTPRVAGGFEIVDKHGRADIYLHGAMAEGFQRGAQALMQQLQGEPDTEVLDAYIAGFATLGRQPLAMH